MDERNAGPLAIVTGAGAGIGRAAALRLARDGYSLACLDIDGARAGDVAAAIKQDCGHAIGAQVDVRSAEAVGTAFEHAAARFGPPRALVNSAGILRSAPALDISPSEWREVVDTNLVGTFIADQAAARLMVGSGRGGRIVNIASVHSQAPGLGVSHYDASKGGVWMLTRNLALELARHDITVNAVGPGLVINTMLGGGTSREYLDAVVPAIPLGRAGKPDDIAGPIAFLCSQDARYITGAMLYVDGGMLLTAHT